MEFDEGKIVNDEIMDRCNRDVYYGVRSERKKKKIHDEVGINTKTDAEERIKQVELWEQF